MSEKTHAEIIAEMNCGPIPEHRHDREILRLYAYELEAAHKRELDEVVALATRYRTALARINALATYCCQPDTRAQIIEQCETIFSAERNGKTKETEATNGK